MRICKHWIEQEEPRTIPFNFRHRGGLPAQTLPVWNWHPKILRPLSKNMLSKMTGHIICTKFYVHRVRALLIRHLSLIIIHFLVFDINKIQQLSKFFTRIMVKFGYIVFKGLFFLLFHLSCYSEIKRKKDDFWGEYE